MSLSRLAGIPVAVMLLAPFLCAAPLIPQCQPGTLAQYEALQFGCNIGPNPTFTFTDFEFQNLGVSVADPLSSIASSIEVVPSFSVNRQLSLSFSSSAFDVGSGQSVKYLLAYTVDPPPPPEIVRFSSQLKTDPPVFPGVAQITTDICVYAPFEGTRCGGSRFSLNVFDNGISSTRVDQTPVFSPVAIVLGVRDIISLNGGATGSASFASFENGTSIVGIPEPAAGPLFASALMLLLMARCVRAKSR